MTTSSIDIQHNAERSRYEARLDGHVIGFAMYREEPGRVVFTHTVVKPEHEGHGVGSQLAEHVIEASIAAGKMVVPECPFIAEYLREHPQYADSVVAPSR